MHKIKGLQDHPAVIALQKKFFIVDKNGDLVGRYQTQDEAIAILVKMRSNGFVYHTSLQYRRGTMRLYTCVSCKHKFMVHESFLTIVNKKCARCRV